MSAVGLESIDHTVQLTHIWINDLDTRLGWDNKHRSYRLLRTVLQAVRDWLPINEAVDLGAQLPALLRGVYYERWRPATTPVKQRSKADFIARMSGANASASCEFWQGKSAGADHSKGKPGDACGNDRNDPIPREFLHEQISKTGIN